MQEHLPLEVGDIIRHKKHPAGPEWRVLERYPVSTRHGTWGYVLEMTEPGPLCWVVVLGDGLEDTLLYSQSEYQRGFMYYVESWAMKRIPVPTSDA